MSLYKRGKIWYMDIVVDGKRINKSTGKKNRRDALKVEEQERQKASVKSDVQQEMFGSIPNLRQAADRVWEDRWSTRSAGEQMFNRIMWICDNFDNPKLNEINRQWVYRLTQTLRKGRKTATVNRYLGHLKTILLVARDEWEIVDKVPKISLEAENNQRTRVISHEEQEQLTNVLRKEVSRRRPNDPIIADLIDFLCDTGLRLSEALGLEPRNFNRDLTLMTVYPQQTKTKKPRSVPITDRVRKILEKRGIPPFDSITIYQAEWGFKAAKEALGITDPEFCLHACRHTFASRLLQTGKVSLYEVKELLGHTSFTTTQRYSHLAVQHLQTAVSHLN